MVLRKICLWPRGFPTYLYRCILYIYICIYIYIYIYVYTYMYIYIYVSIHTHIYIYNIYIYIDLVTDRTMEMQKGSPGAVSQKGSDR